MESTQERTVIEPISADPPFRLERPFARQSWNDLTFIHWEYPVAEVRRLVPDPLDLDLFEGRAYVGLVPFKINDITLARAPAVPWLSFFPETNVRTYVRDRYGRRGVWFFSLDASRFPAVIGARAIFGLPYYWAKMSLRRHGETITYSSQRRHGPPAETDLQVRFGAPIENPSALEVFLTARWRLWSLWSGKLMRADVEHPMWPLHQAELVYCRQTALEAAGLPAPVGKPLVHFSPGVGVFMTGPVLNEPVNW